MWSGSARARAGPDGLRPGQTAPRPRTGPRWRRPGAPRWLFKSPDVQRSVAGRRRARLGLADVSGRVLVDRSHAGEIPRLEGGEGDRQAVPLLQAGQAAEIGQALAFLLRHVVAVGQIRPGRSEEHTS